MSEPTFDVDQAEKEYNAARGQEDGPPTDEPGDGAEGAGATPPNDPPADRPDPPTYMSYEEWIEAGKDPDDFLGKRAFQARYDDIQDNKRLRKELKGLKTTVQQTMDTVNDWQQQERTKIRAELEADLNTAKENEDVEGAIDAQKALDEHDRKSTPASSSQAEHPTIVEFREGHPLIDHDSDDFNEEFNEDVEAFYNGMVQQLSHGGRKRLTDGQIKRALGKAMKDAAELHDIDLGGARRQPTESPRNSRGGGQGKQTRRTSRKPAAPKAEDFTIENPRNPRQGNAATEVRDMLKEKYGEEAAKEFERNLAR